MQETALVLCVASGDATLAALLLVAAVTAWTATLLGSLLCTANVRAPRQTAGRILTIAAALIALTPLIPSTAALAFTITLGLHAIVTAIMRVRDVLESV